MRCAGISEIASGEGKCSQVSIVSFGLIPLQGLVAIAETPSGICCVSPGHVSPPASTILQSETARSSVSVCFSFFLMGFTSIVWFLKNFSWRKAIFLGLKEKSVENLVLPFRILNTRFLFLNETGCACQQYLNGDFWEEHDCGTSYGKRFFFGWLFLLKATV